MEEGEDGFYRFKDLRKREMIPLMFSLKAGLKERNTIVSVH
jgi:hypothetical protein